MHSDSTTLPNLAPETAFQYRITPKRFRLGFVAALIVLLGAIWVSALYGIDILRQNIQLSAKKELISDSVALESHIARALDSVAARLKAASAMIASRGVGADPPSAATLKQLIQDDRFVRSLSLVDSSRKIISSSTARNLGIVIPGDLLPEATSHPDRQEPIFGKVYAGEDLYGGGHETPSGASGDYWVGSMAVRTADETFHLVITIDTGQLRDLWSNRVNEASTRVLLFSDTGQLIVADRASLKTDQAQLGVELRTQFRQKPVGYFTAGPARQWLVSYRGDNDHRFVLALMGDEQTLFAQNSEAIDRFIYGAAILSLFVLAFMGYLFLWYFRYESSATELANQARAMGAHLIVSESDPDGNIIRVNQAFLDRSGYSLKEVVGKNHRMFNSGIYPKDFYRNLWMTVNSGRIWRGTFRNLTKTRNQYWVQATIVPFTNVWGKISRYVALYSDITDAIAHSESAEHERQLREHLTRIKDELASDANTDSLTGLPNRRAFSAFADKMLKVEREGMRPMSALMLDLDFLKLINDSYGHDAGDQVLIELTRRWEKLVRSSDMLARIGGEEFCVLLNDSSSNQAMIVAEKFRLAAATHPVFYQSQLAGRQEIPITVSIGIATANTLSGVLIDDIMRVADVALYEAKNTGRDHIVALSLN